MSKGEANTPSPYTHRHVQGAAGHAPPLMGEKKRREEGKKEEREGGERKGKRGGKKKEKGSGGRREGN